MELFSNSIANAFYLFCPWYHYHNDFLLQVIAMLMFLKPYLSYHTPA